MAEKATKEIKKLLGQWSKTEARTGGIIPDGTYEGKITKGEAIVKNKKLKGHWVMEVTEGKYEGKSVHKWDNISTPTNLEYLKGALETLDVEMDDDVSTVEELNDVMKETEDLSVEFRVVTKEEFTNVYFQQLLDGDDGEADDDEDEDEDEDEEDAEDEDEDEEEEEEEDEEEEEEEKPAKKPKKPKKPGKKPRK